MSLQEAVRSSDLLSLLAALQSGEDPNKPDEGGMTAVHYACSIGNRAVVQRLLEGGGRVSESCSDVSGNVFDGLDIAINEGHRGCVAEIVASGVDIAERPGTYNALDFPGMNGDLPMAQLLTSLGAPLDGSGGRRQPIFWAIQENQLQILQFLVNSGASISQAERGFLQHVCAGYMPLRNAAAEGHLQVVEFLLDCGATIEAIDVDGVNPLEIARAYGHRDVVSLLEKRGSALK
jgi:ankyrin repeat protein